LSWFDFSSAVPAPTPKNMKPEPPKIDNSVDKSKPQERRRAPRYRPRRLHTFVKRKRLLGYAVVGVVKALDFNRFGMALALDYQAQLGDELLIDLQLQQAFIRSLTAVVVNCEANTVEPGYRVGVVFGHCAGHAAISAEDEKTLLQIEQAIESETKE
jgi:hypothetical protein